jgi:hypothetical protein
VHLRSHVQIRDGGVVGDQPVRRLTGATASGRHAQAGVGVLRLGASGEVVLAAAGRASAARSTPAASRGVSIAAERHPSPTGTRCRESMSRRSQVPPAGNRWTLEGEASVDSERRSPRRSPAEHRLGVGQSWTTCLWPSRRVRSALSKSRTRSCERVRTPRSRFADAGRSVSRAADPSWFRQPNAVAV